MKRLASILVAILLMLGVVACGAPADTAPPTIPANITKTTPNSDNIPIFIWDAASDDSSGIASYQVRIDSGAFNDIGNVTTYTAATALSDGGHTFEVRAVDKAGNEGICGSLTFTIDTIPPTISGVNSSDITEISVIITWTIDEPATSQVQYGTSDAYGSTTPLDDSLTTSHSVSLRGLVPNTSYHFRVMSKDEAGNEAVSGDYTFATSQAATEVGGIISSDTMWTKENSPYLITSTIQIPEGVTLTIEPAVTITMPSSGDMFLLNGTILAHGSVNSKIIFDGGNNSNFFSPKNSNADTFLDLDYCVIRNGLSLWPPTGHEQYGHFRLRHCELINLAGYSYIWYPKRDIYIEYNKFVNAGGFSIGHNGDVKVYMQYNLFDGKNSSLPSHANYWIENWASYDSSKTIVKYNSFISTEGIVLELPSGCDKAAMSASENYWGTQDTSVIDAMIYDKKDDITSAGYIDYLPILTEPHPSTPSWD